MEWQTALHENAQQSEQALRKLLAGRLDFTPDPDGGWSFTAEGRLEAGRRGPAAGATFFSGVPDGICPSGRGPSSSWRAAPPNPQLH